MKSIQYSTQPTVAPKQLGIYADRAYSPSQLPHIALLYAFWGQNSADQSNPHNRRYERYTQTGSTLFELAPIEAAQLAVLPFDWSNIATHPSAFDLAQQLAQTAAQQEIPLAIFYLDDATTPVELDNTVVFRTSVTCSTRRPNDVVIPAWSEDFVEYYCQGQLPIRYKSSQPVVGYCGYGSLVKSSGIKDAARLQLGMIPGAAALGSKIGIELVKHPLPWLYGSRVRSQALYILSKSKGIQCNFRLHDVMHHTEKLTLSSRQQFVDNMLNSDYVLCTRGSGNFSYRLYETLSCGRIPVFVNTDCALPFEQWIDWKRYCVWVNEVDLPHLGERIREFHASLTPGQFQERQLECRNLWLNWLSPQAFFSNLYRYL